MELVAIIAIAIVAVAGVVLLWRETPAKTEHPEPSEEDETKDVMVDATPTGFGGGN